MISPVIKEMIARGSAQIKARIDAEERAEREAEERERMNRSRWNAEFLQAARECMPKELRDFVSLGGTQIWANTRLHEAFIDLGPDFAEIGFTLRRDTDNSAVWYQTESRNDTYTVYTYRVEGGYGDTMPYVSRYANGFGTAEWTNDLCEALAISQQKGKERQDAFSRLEQQIEEMNAAIEIARERSKPQPMPMSTPEPKAPEQTKSWRKFWKVKAWCPSALSSTNCCSFG